MKNIVVMGSGQIGQAIIKLSSFVPHKFQIKAWGIEDSCFYYMDLNSKSPNDIAYVLRLYKTDIVINALPFNLNEKVAQASRLANCDYIDFNEDDGMAIKVQDIYKDSNLTCAVKCGLAPGFINYLGCDLSKSLIDPISLIVAVGALPNNVNWIHPADSYNLSWSVDGLVNEYLKPCNIVENGITKVVQPLTERENIIVDGIKYEAERTSGGIGSLISDLKNFDSICYKTLRYPGHYDYIHEILKSNEYSFEECKKEFLSTFPYTKDDVVVVYGSATGLDKNKSLKRNSFGAHYIGHDGLTAIQCTTAGGGLAILEMILDETLKGVINHGDVNFKDFTSTLAFKKSYLKRS